MRNKNSLKRALGLIATSAMLIAGSGGLAYAQVLEEIIVTAQKREQSAQDVGIAITAISGESIKEFGFSSAIDVISKVPSLDNYSTYGPGSTANITIRGIGLNDFGEGHEAPVTAYIDEFYLVAIPAVDFALYDLERVEVLRGPQGTLFGRNSTGGLLHYVTAKPTQETEGSVSLSFAEFGETKLEAALSGALSDTVSGRLSVLSHESDGYIENLNPDLEDGGQAGTDAFRAQLLIEPSEDLSILLKAEVADIDKIHTYYEQQPLAPTNASNGLIGTNPGGTDGAGYNEVNFGAGDRNVTFTNTPQRLEQDGASFLAKIEKDFGEITFTSITGYLDFDRELTEDCDASANNICFAEFPFESDWFTQEFRLNGASDNFRWTAGLYYLDQSATNNPRATFNVPVSGPSAVDPVTGLYNGGFFPIELAANWEQDTTSTSIFGQAEYDFNDKLTGIVGLRVGRDEKDFFEADNATLRSCASGQPGNCFLVADGGNGTAVPFTGDYSETLTSWKLGLDYQANDDVLYYASISQGTKAGGFNNGFYSGELRTNPELLEYDSEENLALEIGIKSSFWENRGRFNASAFSYDYSDFQTFLFEGSGGFVGNNDATAVGAEIESELYVTDRLNLRLGLSYLDAEIEDVAARGFSFDREPANAPEFTANGAVSYDIPFGGDANNVRVIWDWNYVSERFTNTFNDPTAELESYFKHNLTAVVNMGDNWRLSAYVRNISDEENEIKVFVFEALGYRQIINAQGRTVGASVSYSF